MTTTITPYRSGLEAGRDGFGRLLRAEWTKFRTVHRWVLGLAAAALVTVLVSLLSASGNSTSTNGPKPAVAPDGTPVHDSFRFVHQTLPGDGGITVRVRSLTGESGGPEPWAKAGVMVKEDTKAGSAYVAVMVTAGHGVRMQHDFTHDAAGSPASASAGSARWLRLTRSGSTFTGYESADGTRWSRVGTVRVPGIRGAAQAGLFATSPARAEVQRQFGSTSVAGNGTAATGVFDQVGLAGGRPDGAWAAGNVGTVADPAAGKGPPIGSSAESGGTFTVTGSGDIGPLDELSDTVQTSLNGVLVGLLVVIALGTLFITSEYKHGLIRTTLAASPRRGAVLAAKALVIGAVTFAVGLAALLVTFPLAQSRLRAQGFEPPLYPHLTLTDWTVLRPILGTAALLAVAAVLALAVGTVLRHSAGAITLVIVLLVLPQILALALPLSAAQWLLRLTPAAGLAIEQSRPDYPHVDSVCLPEDGCYPLAPWAGFAVLCGYAAVALGLAVWLLRRRDA